MGLLINPVQGLIDRVTGGNATSDAPDVERPAWYPIYEGLMDRGLSSVEAASATANFGAESGFDPAAFNEAGGGQGALGIGQWRGPRQAELRRMAEELGVSPEELGVQLDQTVSELQGTEAGTLAALQGVTDIGEGARIFRDKFERPGGHGYENTAAYANEISTYLGNVEEGETKQSRLNNFSTDASNRADDILTLLSGQNPDGLPSPDHYNPGTAVPGPSAEVSRASPSGSPVLPTGADADAEPEGGGLGGLLDTISSKLFPDEEDSRGRFSEMIGGLGVGLGQMSHGQEVNLQPYFSNIANQKQTIIDAQRAHEQQAQDNVFRDRSIAVQEGQLGVQGRKLAIDTAAANQSMQPGGNVFTKEQLEGIQANPQTRHLIPQLGSRDSKVYGEAIKEYNKIVGDNLNKTDSSGSMSNLHSVASNPNSTPQELSAALEGMDNADVDTVFRMPGLKDNRTALVKNTDHLRKLAETDPEAAAAFEKVLRIQSGMSEFSEGKMKIGMTKMAEYGKAASSATKIAPTIAAFRQVSDEIIKQDGDTSMIGDVLGKMQGVAVGMGFDGVDDFLMQNVTGATADQLAQMNQAEKILAFEIGRQWLEGQGSVSDGERKSLAEGIVKGGTTSSQRSRALSRLEVMGAADQIIYEEFMKHSGDEFEHSIRSENRIMSIAKPAVAAISAAAISADLYDRAPGLLLKGDKARQADVDLHDRTDPSKKGTEDYDKAWKALAMLQAPKISAEQAQMFSKLLNDRGVEYYYDPVSKELMPVPGSNSKQPSVTASVTAPVVTPSAPVAEPTAGMTDKEIADAAIAEMQAKGKM